MTISSASNFGPFPNPSPAKRATRPDIRDMRSGDFACCVQIERLSFDPDFARPMQYFEREQRRKSIGFVSVVAGSVVGFSLHCLTASSIELLRLAVTPAWRGRGIGRAMLTRVISRAEILRMPQVEFLIPESNLGACLWAKACGCRAKGLCHEPIFEGEDAIDFQYLLPMCCGK